MDAFLSHFYLLQFLVFVALFLCSAFFSSTETAFFSLNDIDKSGLEERYPKLKKSVTDLTARAEQFLISILIGNTFVNVMLSTLATVTIVRFFGDTKTQEEATGIAIPIMTFLILIFGEITPKTYAYVKAKELLPRSLPFAYLYFKLTNPLSWTLSIFAKMLTRALTKGSEKKGLLTLEELKLIVDSGREIDADEREMIHSIFQLGETSVKEVMTPRADIIAIPISFTIAQAWEHYRQNQYSRLPVYKDNLDDIVGVFYSKDVFKYFDNPELPVSQLKLRNVIFIPEAKNIEDQLIQFQKTHLHIAIVVDEYGGTSGLVTLEDILEEVVGEITDEKENLQENIMELNDGTYLIRAMTPIEDVGELLNLDLPLDESYDTLGGFVYDKIGRLPKTDDSIECQGYIFKIERVLKRRILWIRVNKRVDK
jgi:putative hemolysin